MSAQYRARRSTSKAALDTDRDSAQSNGATLSLTGDRPDPSSTSSPSRLAAPANFPAAESGKTSKNTTAMLSALPASSLMTSDPPTIDQSKGGFDDHADNRSSSLSELDDASDDQSEPTPRPTTAADLNDNDSEAETERLETTPRKLKRTATDTSFASEQMYTRTPSKLAHSKTVDQDDSAPPSPSLVVDDVAVDAAVDGESALHSLSLIAASEAASLEYAGKKRKRSSAESSTVDEQTDEPARKRSSNVKGSSLNGRNVVDSSEQMDAEEELDNAEERISQLAQEEIDLEERQANIAAEAVSELATVARSLKPRKGGRRGKRKVEDTNHASETPVAPESHDAEGDGENDEEDSATLDEEVAKKRNAIDELAKIEKKFKIFREKLCDEQIAQYEQELEMLKQPNCVHPEYLAMIKCIDERRAEKIAYEKQLLRYKEKNLEIITKAERHQLHSQYFQTVRDVREDILAECNQQLYELQRGRRQLGSDEVEYMMKLPEKRSDQIRHQTAYNLEVSILSGVAKYVGFPAAPEIRPARPAEIEDDLRAMKISTRPAAPPPSYVRPFNRTTTTTTADEAAAEEQFLERTPWANPQHPAHQQTHYGAHAGSSRVPSYQTPAGQRRVVDINASNGSASTIEAHSNPPSSTAYNANGRIGESESPVLQMKRHPGDHSSYLETPGSIPRPIAGLSKESYAGSPQISSSPAAHHVEATSDDHGGVRWGGGGARPLNTIAPGTTSGPVPGRQDGRVPVAQRSGFGTVDLGNGKGLFGR